jgi:hypothetical protein
MIAGMQRENEQPIAQLAGAVVRITDNLDRLVTIVESHQRRLDDIQGVN